MVPRPLHGLSLCAGGGGLDMGLGLAEPGFHTRAFVEWEPYPRSVLVSAMSAGYLAHAPIWDDVQTFDATPFAGAFDTLLAGYPCQPFSAAGQRKGADDERHLWPDVARIACELGSGLRWIFLENVAGHVSLGLETVLRELREMGFTPAAGLFTAAETGAAHERERVFIVAYREGPDRRGELETSGARGRRPGFAGGERELANPAGLDRSLHPRQGAEGRGAPDVGGAGADLGHTQGLGRGEGWPEPELRSGWDAAARAGGAMELASPGKPGLEGRELGRPSGERDRQAASGPASELRRPLLHAPGPADMDRWRFTLDLAPDLAPALSLGHVIGVSDRAAQMVAQGLMAEEAAESLVRRMADGLATRSRALRLYGNGVHPLAAAHAWRTLAAAHGLRPVDLGATASSRPDHADDPAVTRAGPAEHITAGESA